ncbi:MAG: hypothetical protein POELPBGB_03555 [Bacteroidia bacterium]|nr:hypothetical protein [Bacteroidia bacterium]
MWRTAVVNQYSAMHAPLEDEKQRETQFKWTNLRDERFCFPMTSVHIRRQPSAVVAGPQV